MLCGFCQPEVLEGDLAPTYQFSRGLKLTDSLVLHNISYRIEENRIILLNEKPLAL